MKLTVLQTRALVLTGKDKGNLHFLLPLVSVTLYSHVEVDFSGTDDSFPSIGDGSEIGLMTHWSWHTHNFIEFVQLFKHYVSSPKVFQSPSEELSYHQSLETVI